MNIEQRIGEIQAAKQNIAGNYLVLAKHLCEIQEGRLWEQYASHLSNYDDFLREIDIEHATGYNLSAIWRNFGHLLDQRAIGYTRLLRLLPISKNLTDDEKQEWIGKAEHLPLSSLVDEVREVQGKQARDTCPHEVGELWKKCSSCGKFLKENVHSV